MKNKFSGIHCIFRLEKNILQIQSAVFTIFQVREEYIADLVCSVHYIPGQRGIYCRLSLQCSLYSRLERNILQIQICNIFLSNLEYSEHCRLNLQYILGQRGIYCRSSLHCSLYSRLERDILQIQSAVLNIFQVRRNILQIQSAMFTIFQVREEYIADLVCSVYYDNFANAVTSLAPR